MKNRLILPGVFWLCLALPALSGCALLNPGPPVAQVILPVRHTIPKDATRMPAQLLVAQPVTDGATGTDRILALMDGYEIRALDSAKWASPVPWMVQRLLIDAIESTRGFEGVGWEESLAGAGIRLQTDIRRFYLRYDAQSALPVADLAFVFTLVDTKTGKVFARTLLTAEQPCAGSDVREFVAAYSIGMTKILDQCGEWVVRKSRDYVASLPSVE